MTQQDYDNDLVFRSGGEEYARIDGNGEWKTRTPATKLEIRAKDNDEDVTELFCLVTFAEAVVVFVVLAMSPHIGAGRVATLH
jgi:hypothetical protein